MEKILVTGGCGYIGSHTIVDLVQKGFEVISIDNFSRSDKKMLEGVRKITGKEIQNYKIDLCDLEATKNVFEENKNITGIIHFAAYKAVGESVEQPLLYYRNNLVSLINILECAVQYNIPNFIFSSSCSVYGNIKTLPVNEETPLPEAASPYGRTKQIGEEIIFDTSKACNTRFIMLRYFNPVGAHPSAEIGELPIGKPSNLFPSVFYTSLRKMNELIVHGNDYETPDGSCIRDYIHVMDIAEAHSLSLLYLMKNKNSVEEKNKQNLKVEVMNLGTGQGYSVLEVIKAFEKLAGVKLNYKIGERRPGDVAAIYTDNKKAIEKLGWKNLKGLDEMILSAWRWTKKISEVKT
ncbi:UDP-glucose 4-epimerase [Bacteroidota bacterium]|nr:UDP-glucose 4-epimerase [Bacteroidota bacterium]